jgi:NAD(P)-dependent dehydrogenase (short-subunit alcohol dehydrogenase family)
VAGHGPYYAPLAKSDVEQARRNVEAHLLLPLQVARDAASEVRPGGTLLFMGGREGRRTAAGLAFISGLTAALPAMTKNLALELAPIRVNLIAAGFVDEADARSSATDHRHNPAKSARSSARGRCLFRDCPDGLRQVR